METLGQYDQAQKMAEKVELSAQAKMEVVDAMLHQGLLTSIAVPEKSEPLKSRLQVRIADVDGTPGDLLIATTDGEYVDLTNEDPGAMYDLQARVSIAELSRALYAASHFDVPAEDK